MANFTEDKINAVWENAKIVEGYDPKTWRKDVCEAWINRESYGSETDYGWEIDHVLPIAKEGTDHTNNLRAMHWQNNRSKADNFPDYEAVVTAEGNKNVFKKANKTIHHNTINTLKTLYPSNKYLQTTKF